MRNAVVAIMIVIAIGFLASHAIMVVVSVDSAPGRLEASGRTPDVGLARSKAPAGTPP